jgi:hypothetical protein
MGYVAVALLGVLLGALAAGGTALLLLRKMVDRDLAERRLRALVALHESLGPRRDPNAAFTEPAELEQVVRDCEAVAREVRLIAWMFDEPVRRELGRPILDLEDEVRRSRETGAPLSPVRIVEAHRLLDLALGHAAARTLREYRSWRLLVAGRKEGEPAPLPGKGLEDPLGAPARQDV